ncbi:hypothetical protein AWH48_07780 [Domibacillus aminovorans]|uniref:Uncharacterized protein n=1 Tax=Domibacillus aminovorans TaxID=29332 RepID=A0A177KMA1_9BACI|nr:hypothetical protein [Domibacillus aminovorans]OAH54489.1 hypothetical protein AWH48_07780 [Domibacillus aminovorans]
MRKLIKIALLVVLFLALVGGGTLYYFTKVKTYDVADEKVDEIIDSPYSIAYPEGTPIPEDAQKDEEGLVIVDKDGNFLLEGGSVMSPDDWFASPEYAAAVSTGTGGNNNGGSNSSDPAASNGGTGSTGTGSDGSSNTNGGSGNTDAGSGSGSNGETGGTNEAPATMTVDAIKSRYESSFQSLEGQVDSQLGSLISQAKGEYVEKKAAGETVNPAYFYQKYNGAAANVESKTDAAFNSLYTGLTSELKANGFSESHANQYKADYEAMKESRRSELLSKVTGL